MNHLPFYIISSLIRLCLIFIIRSYKYLVSGFFPNTCRFSPSCSCYAIDVLKKYSFWRGCWLIIKRLSRCHPFYNKTRYDPVP